ncbi:MAG: hypothetical protein FWE34_00815 [Defluviitaleaceae bacterium]|nr:hypothetical protein [Defluviitaleaceae bacterium]
MSKQKRRIKPMLRGLIASFLAIILLFATPFAPTVYANDPRDALLGVWRGTYVNNLGINGYEFIIFREGADYLAVVHFFPVEGSPAGQQSGSTLNNVIISDTAGWFEIVPFMDLDMPSGWTASGQAVTLSGGGATMTGHIRNSPEFTLDVALVGNTDFPLAGWISHDHIADIHGVCIFCDIFVGDGIAGFIMRIYYDPMAESGNRYANWQYNEVWISDVDWFRDASRALNELWEVDVIDMWFVENRLYVDLNNFHPGGSSGGFSATTALILSLASIPNVDEIVVMVNGARDVESDHFSLRGIFEITRNNVDAIWGWDGSEPSRILQVPDQPVELETLSQFFQTWQDAYIALLREYSGRELVQWHGLGGQFVLFDIDLDGVPELLVANSFHFQGYFAVYTFANGVIVPIESEVFYDYGVMLAPLGNRAGIITDSFEAGFSSTALMVIEGRRLVAETRLHSASTFATGNIATWQIDGWAVPEAEFEAAYRAIIGEHGENELIERHDISEPTIQNVIFGWQPRATFFEAESGPNQYIIAPTPQHLLFVPQPWVLQDVTEQMAANQQIRNVIQGLTPDQRNSGDAMNMATLHIENLQRRGTTQPLPQSGTIDAGMLLAASSAADNIHAEINSALAFENMSLMRNLRTNVNFVAANTDGMLFVRFSDNPSPIASFDNVTVEGDFVSITVAREHALQGNEVSVRMPQNNVAIVAASVGGFSAFLARLADFSSPLTILANYWSIIAIIALVAVAIILGMNGKKFRLWVVPTFAVLLLATNIGMTLWVMNLNQDPAGAVVQNNEEMDDALADVEIEMTNGIQVTLSLPTDGVDMPQNMVLLNAHGQPQHTKFNPITNTIDATVSESGIFTLVEPEILITDIGDKNPLMQDAIIRLVARDIMQGAEMPDGSIHFNPDYEITLLDFVSAMAGAFNRSINFQISFDGTTKAQMTSMIADLLVEHRGYLMPSEQYEIDQILSKYLDRHDIALWLELDVALATKTNALIFRADGLFAPDSVMTRGDAAVIIYRLFNRAW